MKFKSLPVLQVIDDLYAMPRSKSRFEKYLQLLQGKNKNDLIMPIAGFNPMAKEKAHGQLKKLINLKSEELLQYEISSFNKSYDVASNRMVKIAINLIDDQQGAWSERYSTSYKSTFDLRPMLKQGYSIVNFWTSEDLSTDLITLRIREQLSRTQYCLLHGHPHTLRQLVDQEVYLNKILHNDRPSICDVEQCASFIERYGTSDRYDVLFNFFYGDEASDQLAYPTYGCTSGQGFHYAQYIAALGE